MKFIIKKYKDSGMICLEKPVLEMLKLKVGDIVDVEMCRDSVNDIFKTEKNIHNRR